MKSINNSLFKKSEIYNSGNIVGGFGASTHHTPTLKKQSNGDKHYVCDHSPDPCEY